MQGLVGFEDLGVEIKKTGSVNLSIRVQSTGQVEEKWECFYKFGSVKHSLRGWLPKPLRSCDCHNMLYQVVCLSSNIDPTRV